ncbi:carbohydrate ABC transporter substrate-binding protein (CUT1 family) [Orenia metallireducens]|jgi:multiple sugar transport system substrate-binding protein|uniref:Carbohydrate ABC transporter substrate-binding protein, CUT1 family n=1 Tax=Orenia metallireducens TaxID=1413210 RepID=A0A285G7V8_9FIRM|nr:extracellular solute-binding protein [Orenia metallireducens]PRX28288.1 carbohydrate ABC transporter substrate-binding protein (CUT1 family) [Orenia metallireducens]SNY19498.1 carbohydrate ABC transporter substrate-binding protein, CUT1 family [Orenia metallireducens]
MLKKKTIITTLALVLVFSLSMTAGAWWIFGGGDKKEDDGTVTIRFAWWGSQSRHERTLKVIKLFEQKYPNIKVQPEYTGWGGYWDKMNAQAAGKNLPDVIQHVRKYISGYAENGQLLDLSPYIKDGSLDTTNIADVYLQMGQVYGKQIGLATGVNAPAGYYDKELFDKAGVAYPSSDDTWEDRAEMFKKLHDRLGIFGASTPTAQQDGTGFTVYLRQHGADFFAEDGKSLGYDNDQLFVDFMKMDLDLMKSGAVQNASQRQESARAIEEDLVTKQKAATATNYWSNQLAAISTGAGKMLTPFLYPTAKDQTQEGRFLKPAMLLTVSSNTEHPEEVMKFLNFWFHNVEAGKILGTDRGTPVESKVKSAVKMDAGKYDQMVFGFIDKAAANAGSVLPPQPPAYQEVVKAYEEVYWKVIYKQISPQEGAKLFRKEANSILGR